MTFVDNLKLWLVLVAFFGMFLTILLPGAPMDVTQVGNSAAGGASTPPATARLEWDALDVCADWVQAAAACAHDCTEVQTGQARCNIGTAALFRQLERECREEINDVAGCLLPRADFFSLRVLPEGAAKAQLPPTKQACDAATQALVQCKRDRVGKQPGWWDAAMLKLTEVPA